MDILTVIAENKIREAMARGELDNLPGQGKPMELDDLSHVPDELRAGYIMLKNAEVLPEEIQLKKDIMTLQRLIDCCYSEHHEDDEVKSLRRKLNEKILRYDMLMEKRNSDANHALSFYKNKIYKKLGGY